MAWLRCPHCTTLLPNARDDEDAVYGCPACGGVFAPTASASNGIEPLYPAGPRDVPDGLTIPSARYRSGVLLLFATLILFFFLYLILLIGSGCLIFWSLRYLGFFGLPFAFLFFLVFLYLLKGFFKTEREGKTLQVEISEEEQPRLFDFIYRVCEEVGAAPPHRVFLSPEVNAAACYEHTMLGLLRPTPKNLILGMGLINVLNLSEFKAVLAHEFGHFAQGSMKLTNYVYAINRVLIEMVAGQDWLDRALLRLRAEQNIIGLFGTFCWCVVTGLRKAMTGLFYAINFLDKSLSRQMEFHADLVAVRLTGSEAIVRGLSRLTFAGEALDAAVGDLKLAADHNRYSRDLFTHQRDAMQRLREQRKNPQLGEPPPLTGDPMLAPEVFDPEDGPPKMWADHPSNYDREQNAKRHYVRCALDDRPAWLLFTAAEEVCEQVTWRFYRVVWKVRRDADLEEAEAIRDFLHEERQAVTYEPRYQGMYDDRFLSPGDLNDLVTVYKVKNPSAAALRQRHAALYGGELAERAAVYKRHIEERKQLSDYRREYDPDKEKPLKFRGRRYHPEDVEELLEFIDKQLEKDCRLLAEEDTAVFVVHYQMSRQLGGSATQELRQRYAFHLEQQRLVARLLSAQNQLGSALFLLADERDGVLPAKSFAELVRVCRRARDTLRQTLEEADTLRLPPLLNLKEGGSLGAILWDRRLVGSIGGGGSLSLKKVQKLHDQLAEVIERARHLHFKSLGGILSLQEKIAQQWFQRVEEEGERSA